MKTFLVVIPLLRGDRAVFLYQADKYDPLKEITRLVHNEPIFKHNPLEMMNLKQLSVPDYTVQLDHPNVGLLGVF